MTSKPLLRSPGVLHRARRTSLFREEGIVIVVMSKRYYGGSIGQLGHVSLVLSSQISFVVSLAIILASHHEPLVLFLGRPSTHASDECIILSLKPLLPIPCSWSLPSRHTPWAARHSPLNYDDTADRDWGRDATFLQKPDSDSYVKHLKEEAGKKKQPSIEKELRQEIVDLFICHLQWYPATHLLVFSSEELSDIDSQEI
jgi:hypothetical protein